MSVSASRTVTVVYTGEVTATLNEVAAVNAASPGQIQIQTLSAGNNTITPPASGTTPQAVIIVPPAGNVQTMTLKGVGGDTGILLHLTDPTVIGLGNPAATFVITAGGTITGLRTIWI